MSDFTWILAFLFTGNLLLRVGAVDVTVEVGLNVTLVCPLGGTYVFPEWIGPPPDNTALTSGSDVIAEGMEYVNDKDLLIVNVTTSHAGVYTCRIDANQLDTVNLIVNSFDYTVTFSDVYKHTLFPSYIPATNNTNLTVTCTVGNAFPEPQVVIGFLEPGTLVLSDLTLSSNLQADNTYTVTASVNITFSEDLDRKIIYCNATSGDESWEKEETIRVTYPVLLSSYYGVSDFPAGVNSGHFGCTAYNIWPTASFKWTFNGRDIVPAKFEIQSMECQAKQGGISTLYDCESKAMYANLTKEDNMMTIACSILHLGKPDGGHTWNMTLFFPPTEVTMQGTDPTIQAEAGKNATVTCATDSAMGYNGSSGVTFVWRIEQLDVNFTMVSHVEEPGQYGGLVTMEIVSFPVTKEMDGTTVECEVKQWYLPIGPAGVLKTTKRLDILYAPTIMEPFYSRARTYRGNTLEIYCGADSNPTSNLSLLAVTDGSQLAASANTNLLVHRIETYQYAGGKIRCIADNGISPSASKDVEVVIMDKPADPVFGIRQVADDQFTVEITSRDHTTASTKVPQHFYVQYKMAEGDSAAWSEVDLTSNAESTQSVEVVKVEGLQPDTAYNFRLRIVNTEGDYYYSGSTPTVTTTGEKMVSAKDYRTAIYISVFVTFGVMLIILIVVVCVMRGSYGGKKDKAEFVSM